MSRTSLCELLLEGAGRATPSKAAVIGHADTLTYEALWKGARGIASVLADAGIGKGERVAFWMDKTPASVQVLLGTLLAGAAYVPLDPRAPWRRCRAILENCQIAALAINVERSHISDLTAGIPLRLLLFHGPGGPSADARVVTLEDAMQCPAREMPSPAPEDIAYVLYTSGSTGVPKGVVHTHRSGLAFAEWVCRTYGITSADVFSSHAPLHFDLSILDLFASLGSGASVRLITVGESMLAPYLVKQVPHWGITVWYSVPSILISMLEGGRLEDLGFGQVHTLLFAGEVFPTPQLRRLQRALPGVRLSNLFGPTETNVCTYYDVPSIPDDRIAPIPIGHACDHLETFVLDDDGREVGLGQEGTLWVRGGNLMAGYWNDHARTEATLRPDPRGVAGLAYCTGDRVCLQADGDYEFRGRRDHMIKIRGYRVELGEVESVLASYPALAEAVAVPLTDHAAGHRLVATVVPRAGQAVTAKEVQAFCAARLPTYMIPGDIDLVSALPRTATGKADRAALRRSWEEKGAS